MNFRILPAGGTVGVLIGTKTRNGIMSNRLLEDNIELGNALLDMYVICANLEKNTKTIDDISVRDVNDILAKRHVLL